MPIRLDAAAVSDRGRHRPVNQDAAFTAPWGCAVADGVGGGPSGDLASAALVHRLVSGWRASGPEGMRERIREANWDLRAHVERDPSLRGMATTFTGLFLDADSSLMIAHTGDSRAYRWWRGALVRQTRDDSYVQALLDQGLITDAEAATHPRRNWITASLGGGEDDSVGVAVGQATAGERWLLCSDGVTDYLSEAELADHLRAAPTPASAAAAIVAGAIEADSHDNVTAVVCDVVDAPAPTTMKPVFYGSAAIRFAEDVATG